MYQNIYGEAKLSIGSLKSIFRSCCLFWARHRCLQNLASPLSSTWYKRDVFIYLCLVWVHLPFGCQFQVTITKYQVLQVCKKSKIKYFILKWNKHPQKMSLNIRLSEFEKIFNFNKGEFLLWLFIVHCNCRNQFWN